MISDNVFALGDPSILRKMAKNRIGVKITRRQQSAGGFVFKVNGKAVLSGVSHSDACAALWSQLVSAGCTQFEIVPRKGRR